MRLDPLEVPAEPLSLEHFKIGSMEMYQFALQDLMKQIHNAGTVKPRIENGIILERSFLIEQSQAYFSF